MPPLQTVEGLTRLGDAFSLEAPPLRRRMLVVVNPYATTVSDRLRTLVVSALQGQYEVDAIDTRAKGDATRLAREAATEGYDVIVAFGGDGTLNEVANGMVGSDTPLCHLPGGSTNVFGRMLGIPNDIVDATEHLLRVADRWRPRRVDLPEVNGRVFTFSAGVGLDARVVEQVDAHPWLKRHFGSTSFVAAGVATFLREYARNPPRMTVDLGDGRRAEGVTTLVQNGDPYTYFRGKAIHMAEGTALDDGQLGGLVLESSSPAVMPGVIRRAFTDASMLGHRRVTGFSAQETLVCTSADGRPLPLQVDGDFVDDVLEARFSIRPGGLVVVA